MLERFSVGINLALMFCCKESVEQFLSGIACTMIVISKQPIVILQHIWISEVFKIFSCFKVVGNSVGAEQAIVGCITDERRFEEILHSQLGDAPALLDELSALEGSELCFQCMSLAQQGLNHIKPEDWPYYGGNLEYQPFLSGKTVDTCQ